MQQKRTEKFGEDTLVTTAELAEWLGLSVRTIEGLRRDAPDRLPPHIRIGARTIRYRVGDVRDWLAHRGIATDAEDSAKLARVG